MDVFILENGIVKPTPELLLLPEFNQLWNRFEDKEIAMKLLAYVYFFSSMRKENVYAGYTDPNERKEKIISGLKIDRKLIKDNIDIINKCIGVIKQFQKEASPSLKFYESALNAANKMANFFNNFDFNRVSPRTGMPLYKPADITRALKDTNEILKTLTSMKEKVHKELYEASKGKGGREINYFER